MKLVKTTNWTSGLFISKVIIRSLSVPAKLLETPCESLSRLLWFFRIITDSKECSHGIHLGLKTSKHLGKKLQESLCRPQPEALAALVFASCSFYKKREDKKALKSSNGFIAQQRRYLCHIALTKLCITLFPMSSNWTISITGGSSTPLSIISGIRFRHIPYARYVIWNICRSR